MASTPAAPTAPAPQESVITRLLGALNTTLTSPQDAAILGMAEGLGQAGAPHMLTPVPLAQGIAMGLADAQKYQQAALANTLQQTALIPYQKARAQIATNVAQGNMYQLTPAEQAAVASGKFTPQILQKLSGMETQLKVLGVNTDSIPIFREAETWAKNNVTPYGQPANTRTVSAAGAATGGAPPAQGTLPTGTAQGPGGAIAPLPGALPSIQGIAGAGAAGTYPYQSALKLTGLMQGPQSNRVLSLAPAMPPLFNPGLPAAGPSSPSPAALQAAIAAQRQRQMGTIQGVTGAAQASGLQAPFNPTQPPPSTGAVGPNPSPPGTPAAAREFGATPAGRAHAAAVLRAANARPILTLPQRAAAGNRLISPGLSPAQIELQKQAAMQTGAQETASAKESESAQAQLARLTEMQQALNRIPVGGNLGKVYDGIANVLNYSGVKLPGLQAIQEYEKYRTNFVADAARKMGAKVSYQEVGYIARGVPDFTLAGNAPRALLGQLTGAAQYDIARNQALKYYATSVPNPYGAPYQGTDRGFEQWWQKSGVTPGLFMFFSTMDALPAAQRAQYAANFGRNSTGTVYLNQYRKGQAFLKQHPQLVPFLTGQQ